ncbi:MAG: general secretion pathway protein GspB [Xanthomonadaceae bacterium]|nr:general secretion pathway protein GspB [Xanthomonadaceae bacterium]
MSFILEALRKSEAARRRSEAPDLFSTMQDAPAPARERSNAPAWIVGVVGVVGVLSLGVATWLVLQRDATPDASGTQVAVIEATNGSASTPGQPGGDDDVLSSAAQPAPSSPSVPQTAPTPPVAAASQPPAPPPSATAPVPAPAASAPLPEPPPAQRPAVPHPSNDGRPMSLSELDAGSRKQLPALKMSMHMWNEDGDRRFVILDGQRLGEGDLIGDAQVESITRDGVILNWQGARLRIDMR